MSRAQHIVGSGFVAAVGLWVTIVSYTRQPAEAFLFPRIVATVFLALAVWTFVKALRGRSRIGSGLSLDMARRLAPGLIVALVYVFWAAKALGFYTATAAAFFVLLSLYDPASHASPLAWIRRALATICFLAVMYGLFKLLLKVYTPREILF